MCVCVAGDSHSNWGSRTRHGHYDRMRTVYGGVNQHTAGASDRSQRMWNGRQSYADSSASGRYFHLRASDPVGWSLLNSASGDVPSSSSSAWENSSYMQDLQRRRRRQLRMASPSWSNTDVGADHAESPPPSWQTLSLHGTQPTTNVQRSELSVPPYPRHRSAADNNQSASGSSRSTVAGSVFHETSSLADIDFWPSSRRERDGTSFAPIFVDDIENDAEDITSTGAEAGSTASIGGDTESIDADAEMRSADFELGSVGAEVVVSGSSGSGAEVAVSDPSSSRTQYESADFGPSTSDMAVTPSLRSGSGYGTSRVSSRLAELVDLRDRASQRRWRRFNQADLQDRGNHPSSSAAASNDSMRITDWLEFEWSADVVPRRLPQRRDIPEFYYLNYQERDTSAASDVRRPHDYMALRWRRSRPSYAGFGAASNSASSHSHECLPNCEICSGAPSHSVQPSNRYMSELSGDRRRFDSSSRARPVSTPYETLAPAASAVDDDSIFGSLADLRREIETTRSTVPSFSWRESSASSVDSARFPAAAEFERRVRRLDERVSQMQRLMSMRAEHEPRPPSLGYRLRERQDALRSQLEMLRSRIRTYPSQVADSPDSRNYFDDDLLPSSASTSGYGSTGAEAVSQLIDTGQ